MRKKKNGSWELENRAVICAGNGPSLNRIPREFLNEYPLFVVNHWPVWTDQLFNYWVGTDRDHMEVALTVKTSPAFVPSRYERLFDQRGDDHSHLYSLYLESHVPGVPWHKPFGAMFSTTLLSAAALAFEMGAHTVLLVGFDCTWSPGKHHGDGITGTPHWYDPNKTGGRVEIWDRQAGMLAHYVQATGRRLINLSDPTACRSLTREPWQNWAHETLSVGRGLDTNLLGR